MIDVYFFAFLHIHGILFKQHMYELYSNSLEMTMSIVIIIRVISCGFKLSSNDATKSRSSGRCKRSDSRSNMRIERNIPYRLRLHRRRSRRRCRRRRRCRAAAVVLDSLQRVLDYSRRLSLPR